MSFMDVARIASGQLRLVSPPRRRIATTEGFYIPPEDLGEGKPGDVIRAEPVDAYLVPGVRFRARAWRMLYRSTSAIGEPTAVSGTLLVPYGRIRGPRPLVGYASRHARHRRCRRAVAPAGPRSGLGDRD